MHRLKRVPMFVFLALLLSAVVDATLMRAESVEIH